MRPTYLSLGDLHEVTSILVEEMAAAQIAASSLLAQGARRAIVATAEVAFEAAGMFASFSERAGHEVRVFRDMTLAGAWRDQ